MWILLWSLDPFRFNIPKNEKNNIKGWEMPASRPYTESIQAKANQLVFRLEGEKREEISIRYVMVNIVVQCKNKSERHDLR